MSENLAAHDKSIREPLFEYLEEVYGKIRILEEKRTGKARADVVMVLPGAVCGIEIKSDRDTYARLESQVKYYDMYYDYNIVAVGSSHAMHIEEHVPAWWGIITLEEVEGTLDFYMLRRPEPNPKVKAARKITLLWRPELARLQEMNHLPAYREKSKRFVQKKILEKVPEEVLWPQVSELLFQRDYADLIAKISAYRKKRN